MIRVESKELKIQGKWKGSASEDICHQAWLLKSNPWDPHGGRGKPISKFPSNYHRNGAVHVYNNLHKQTNNK